MWGLLLHEPEGEVIRGTFLEAGWSPIHEGAQNSPDPAVPTSKQGRGIPIFYPTLSLNWPMSVLFKSVPLGWKQERWPSHPGVENLCYYT